MWADTVVILESLEFPFLMILHLGCSISLHIMCPESLDTSHIYSLPCVFMTFMWVFIVHFQKKDLPFFLGYSYLGREEKDDTASCSSGPRYYESRDIEEAWESGSQRVLKKRHI